MKNYTLSLVISYLLLLWPILASAQQVQSLSIGSQAYPNATANNLVTGSFAVGANLSAAVVLTSTGAFGLTVEGTPDGAPDPSYSANFAATAATVPLGPIQLPAGQAYVLRFYTRPGRVLLATYTIFNQGVTLPVTLASFAARNYGKDGAALRWESTNETLLHGYIVERSMDGTNFTDCAHLLARGAGIYQAIDQDRANYYRLRCENLDGSVTYSPVVALAAEKAGPPHVVQVGDHYFTYQLRAGEVPARIELFSVAGQRLLEQLTDLHRLNYPSGQEPYLLILFTTHNRPITQRVF